MDINNEKEMQEMYKKYYPAGSGPLGMMRIICQLIKCIAEDKGFNMENFK